MTSQLPTEIAKALEATGLPWEIREGTKHRKIIIAGRFVTTLPHGKCKVMDRKTKNVVGHIRRAAKCNTAQ